MKKQNGYFDECIKILQQLKKSNPNLTLGQHISTAFADYGDCWGTRDEELYFALDKYRTELELNQQVPDKDIDKIIEEGKNLDTIVFDDEENDFYD